MEKLRFVNSWIEDCQVMEKHIRRQGRTGVILEILEAGCGRNWAIDLQGIQYRLTGVDLSKKLLEMRKNTLNDLHVAIAGDLRDVKLEPNRYDVIYNSY